MKILITGITGMVGSHLAEYVLNNHPEVEVHGLIRWRSPLDNIRHIKDRVQLHHGDLHDLNSLIVLTRCIIISILSSKIMFQFQHVTQCSTD